MYLCNWYRLDPDLYIDLIHSIAYKASGSQLSVLITRPDRPCAGLDHCAHIVQRYLNTVILIVYISIIDISIDGTH